MSNIEYQTRIQHSFECWFEFDIRIRHSNWMLDSSFIFELDLNVEYLNIKLIDIQIWMWISNIKLNHSFKSNGFSRIFKLNPTFKCWIRISNSNPNSFECWISNIEFDIRNVGLSMILNLNSIWMSNIEYQTRIRHSIWMFDRVLYSIFDIRFECRIEFETQSNIQIECLNIEYSNYSNIQIECRIWISNSISHSNFECRIQFDTRIQHSNRMSNIEYQTRYPTFKLNVGYRISNSNPTFKSNVEYRISNYSIFDKLDSNRMLDWIWYSISNIDIRFECRIEFQTRISHSNLNVEYRISNSNLDIQILNVEYRISNYSTFNSNVEYRVWNSNPTFKSNVGYLNIKLESNIQIECRISNIKLFDIQIKCRIEFDVRIRHSHLNVEFEFDIRILTFKLNVEYRISNSISQHSIWMSNSNMKLESNIRIRMSNISYQTQSNIQIECWISNFKLNPTFKSNVEFEYRISN